MNRLLKAITYILLIHLSCLMIMCIIRGTLIYTVFHLMDGDMVTSSFIFESLLRGTWLDNCLLSYADILPLLCVLTMYHTHRLIGKVLKYIAGYFAFIHAIAIGFAIANIPYISEFGKTMDASVFAWLNGDASVANMLFEDWKMVAYMVVSVIVWGVYAYWCFFMANRIGKKMNGMTESHVKTSYSVAFSLFLILVCWLGIRGRISGRPIKMQQAFFSKDKVLNQATLCPALYIITSMKDMKKMENERICFLDDEQLDKYSRVFFGKGTNEHPLSVHVAKNDSAQLAGVKPNIVLIFLESMSIHYMNSYDKSMNVTPYLDSLYNNSLHFSNCYSTGFRTNNGIAACLYSQPAYLERHNMRYLASVDFRGLPYELHNMGYHNMFFVTHGAEFDELGSFVTQNNFDELFSRADYPESEVVNSWGVSDRFLYNYAIDKINKVSRQGKPFLSALLTIANHQTYYFPPDFHGKSKSEDLRAVELADWYLKGFMERAKKETWYDNTIFVIVGDHGKLFKKPDCEIADQTNHVPLIIFGKRIPTMECTSLTSQMDIPAILLGLLGHEYDYENLGKDVMKKKRDYVCYSTMEHIACRSKDRLFGYHVSENRRMYFRIDGRKMTEVPCDSEFENMEHYCFATFQLSDMIHK